MKIGIFGGSFNPPHNMHQDIANGLIKKGYIDKVIFVPTGNRYDKKELVEAKERYHMLQLICNKYEQVSDFEITNNLVYTYQTLEHFKNLYINDEILFIVGADNLAELDTWKRYKYLLENYKFLVVKRKGENVEKLLKRYNFNPNIIITDIKMENISSTMIRNLLKNGSKEVYKYVNKRVIEYIMDKRLYTK